MQSTMKRASCIFCHLVLLASVDSLVPPRPTIAGSTSQTPLLMATTEEKKSGFLGRVLRRGKKQDQDVVILESPPEEEGETTTSSSSSTSTSTSTSLETNAEDVKEKPGFFGRVFGRRGGKEDKEQVAAVMDPVTDPANDLKSSSEMDLDIVVDEECVIEDELTETEKLMKQVKEAGTAGVVSYALWELAFWCASVPVAIAGFEAAVGHWPNFSDSDDMSKLGAEAFAFVNFARFAVPLRIGLALGTTPWIQENVIDRFFPKEESECVEPMEEINV